MYAKSNEQILDLILVQVKKNNNFQRNYDSQKIEFLINFQQLHLINL